jgi:hypothetical protein
MEREEVLVRFSDLRRLASSIPNYVAKKVGENKLPTLKTAIEDNLGIVGLDTQELIFEFSEAYTVDLSKFDFTGCISPEPSGNPLILVLLPLYAGLFILAWIANIIAALFYAPFSLQKAELMLKAGIDKPSTIARELIFPDLHPRPTNQILTIGDFVASAATGYFVKREQVRFVLSR